ncbi:unnamed protein product [Musa acuminata subsp. malaccensis]|uniref:(wild Malaysian banana) hypothetical protein n=1 Tax=Musa acuminata subsp. malaccensis TaxID=214687 RepID=A0A804L9Y0_MUSAM|nr:unnamed protein product [Musa acuminata subsp. malaccensis]
MCCSAFILVCVKFYLYTAVIPIRAKELGEKGLHLVAMASRKNPMSYACLWGFIVQSRLYESSVMMLNLRCLGIVFDLDETLIVPNTMWSFKDQDQCSSMKISNETDPPHITSMLAEIKHSQDDKLIMKQYADSDQVVDNGKVFKVQSEVVLPLSDSHQLITRPIIRLHAKYHHSDMRDTSVLV